MTATKTITREAAITSLLHRLTHRGRSGEFEVLSRQMLASVFGGDASEVLRTRFRDFCRGREVNLESRREARSWSKLRGTHERRRDRATRWGLHPEM